MKTLEIETVFESVLDLIEILTEVFLFEIESHGHFVKESEFHQDKVEQVDHLY